MTIVKCCLIEKNCMQWRKINWYYRGTGIRMMVYVIYKSRIMTFTKRIIRLITTTNPNHATIYTTSHRSYHLRTPLSPSNNPTPCIKSIFLDVLKDLEALISTNECNYEVNNALKTDGITITPPFNYIRANITTPSMSVILRKMRPKQILSIFTTGHYFLQSNWL